MFFYLEMKKKKVHTGIALDNTYMLHAYKHFDNCTGMPIQRMKIEDIKNKYKNKKV